MINWTEEDVKFIVEFIVMPIAKEIMETNDRIDKSHEESYGRIFDAIIDRLNEVTYKGGRDVAFILDLIAKHEHIDRNSLYNVYNEYCYQYDKLHKEKAND